MAQPDPPGDDLELNWDFLDVVASNGACLVTRPNTPHHISRSRDIQAPDFATALTSKLDWLLRVQESRRRKYGDAAFEYLPRHTPPELVEKRKKELETLYELMDAPSPPSDGSDGDDLDVQAGLERRKEMERILCGPKSETGTVRPPTPSPSDIEMPCSDGASSSATAYGDNQSRSPASEYNALEAATARAQKRRRSTEGEDTRPGNNGESRKAPAIHMQLRHSTRFFHRAKD